MTSESRQDALGTYWIRSPPTGNVNPWQRAGAVMRCEEEGEMGCDLAALQHLMYIPAYFWYSNAQTHRPQDNSQVRQYKVPQGPSS